MDWIRFWRVSVRTLLTCLIRNNEWDCCLYNDPLLALDGNLQFSGISALKFLVQVNGCLPFVAHAWHGACQGLLSCHDGIG